MGWRRTGVVVGGAFGLLAMHCEDQGVGFVHRSATEASQQPQDESGGSGAVGFAGGRAGSDGGSGAVGGPGVSGGSAGATSAGNGAIPGVAGRGSGGAGNGGAGVNAGAGSDGASAGESPVGGAGGQPECGREVTWDGERLVDTDEELAELEGVEVIHGTLVIKKARHLGPLACLRLVDGGLTIGRVRSDDLRGLEALEDVTGQLTLRNVGPSFEGLRSLTRVGHLVITENPKLKAPVGLEALKTIRGDFRVFWNDELTSLHGLEGLEKAGYVRIDENPKLTNLDGLEALASVRSLVLKGDVYSDLGALGNLTAVQEEVYLDLACSLEGLHNVKSVGTLWLNGSMPSLSGLRGLELVEGDSFRRLFRISNRSSVLSRLAAG